MMASAQALVVECQELWPLLGNCYAPKHPDLMFVLCKKAAIER